ncbi:hypothetical protein, partial [Catellatospora sp. NPDC049609]|uniref:hypothetical protein n=1 Tax=Catellatospora sp. NPDC049609 TaxID=3155505 RepID=UPI003447E521
MAGAPNAVGRRDLREVPHDRPTCQAHGRLRGQDTPMLQDPPPLQLGDGMLYGDPPTGLVLAFLL